MGKYDGIVIIHFSVILGCAIVCGIMNYLFNQFLLPYLGAE